jgi:hypothetical protein
MSETPLVEVLRPPFYIPCYCYPLGSQEQAKPNPTPTSSLTPWACVLTVRLEYLMTPFPSVQKHRTRGLIWQFYHDTTSIFKFTCVKNTLSKAGVLIWSFLYDTGTIFQFNKVAKQELKLRFSSMTQAQFFRLTVWQSQCKNRSWIMEFPAWHRLNFSVKAWICMFLYDTGTILQFNFVKLLCQNRGWIMDLPSWHRYNFSL